jgi:RNA polymerase sigma-70 factor, ECF subfamily
MRSSRDTVNSVQEVEVSSLLELFRGIASGDAADARLDAAALVPRLRTAIGQLPEAQRLVVTLRDVEGLSSSEVCDVLSISQANERVLLHRGRNKLRSVLNGYLKGG